MSAEYPCYADPYAAPATGHPAQGVQYPAGYPAQHQGQAMGMAPVPYPYSATGHYPSYAYQTLQAHAYPMQQSSSFLDFSSDRFLKGFLIGAAATYILTNESVQRTAIKGAVKLWSLVQGGVEELKERFQDAEAEIRAAEAAKGE
jgi:hypothetical protein